MGFGGDNDVEKGSCGLTSRILRACLRPPGKLKPFFQLRKVSKVSRVRYRYGMQRLGRFIVTYALPPKTNVHKVTF